MTAGVSDFLLVTHTNWSEAPRIRHQVARLLLDAGHCVHFLERPRGPMASGMQVRAGDRPGLNVVSRRELLHRQLRVLPILDRMNASFVERELRSAATLLGLPDGVRIVNFASDYWFLRRTFPGSRITTIIHDDFEALCRLPYRGHVTEALRRTCLEIDDVRAVSEPLRRRLSQWCNAELFLPWSIVPYRAPAAAQCRDTLLFWGCIDRSLDVELIARLSTHLAQTRPSWRIELVGPTASRRRGSVIAPLSALGNVAIRGQTDLDDLPMDRCAAAIMPYRSTPIVNAVTLANKSMQLLARGMPLLISAMPSFVQEPFVFRLDGPGGIEHGIRACEASFDAVKPVIRAFLAANSPASRLRQLGVEPAGSDRPGLAL